MLKIEIETGTLKIEIETWEFKIEGPPPPLDSRENARSGCRPRRRNMQKRLYPYSPNAFWPIRGGPGGAPESPKP